MKEITKAQEYYSKNKKLIKNKIENFKREYKQRNIIYVKEYLKSHPCIDCNNSDIRVLDFHHLRDKHLTISKMIYRAYSISNIQLEINKCVVLCSNCHRIRHYEMKIESQSYL